MDTKGDKTDSMEFDVGAVLEGKVTGITKFGAFVALPDGKTGLVHISEIANTYVNDVREHLEEGQTVRVKVLGMEGQDRINLSIKKAAEPPQMSRPRRTSNRGPGESGGTSQTQHRGHAPRHSGPKEPATFEERLKQFMQASDSKMSDLNRSIGRKSGARRGRR